MSLARSTYSALLYSLTPFLLGRTLWRSIKQPQHRERLLERLGFVPKRQSIRSCIWLHAVSVGETIAAKPLIEALLTTYPDHDLWITSTTLTGSQTVQRLFKNRVLSSYMPYDLPDAMRRFVQRVQPNLVLIMETELWPNLYAQCAQHAIPLALLNARLSPKSFKGYQQFHTLTQPTLQPVSLIAARSAQDAEYFKQLGANAAAVKVAGNIKFDLNLPSDLAEKGRLLRNSWGKGRPVWVAASTHAGEDEIILAVWQNLKARYPELLLILVPRHPERFNAVAELAQTTGFNIIRRSVQTPFSPQTDMMVGDTMGELLLWYAASDIAFIGGSLIPQGGHNPLEASALKVPVISGDQVHNFADIYPPLIEAGGAVLVNNAQGLEQQIRDWLEHPIRRQQAGQAGFEWLQPHRGVVKRLMQWIEEVKHEKS
ncbi:MAG: lipid IV(A) 3-deoxy-D-manno-octulosonic acid transferase [Thiofilum sp.]|uniref:lipid IV(A) 3-deoxy-D-manno-octulosonic acid transferase n=1 Tax=Thiofilum sp. TaxID=2212733 RepID=UPI0025F91D2F|nr:lipid IV(A) 3-deoxy-D-manno-octulosonic acid transferase [Thiofilum sp.]MBK8452176.1 lipid IV(A) 3-deoxy-D-manno-octulosonic acid transferase [Thiofilum sp.]